MKIILYTLSQGYFPFKIKNNNKVKESNTNEIKENNLKDNFIKKNESLFESRASSKYNFKINDDIHESEFNDVEFLD